MWRRIGKFLARYLEQPTRAPTAISGLEHSWTEVLRPGDVILVEGCTRIATAIKYLTQSTWSHAALYVGDVVNSGPLIEANLTDGVAAVPLEKYVDENVRVCRPIGLTDDEIARVARFAERHIGMAYDVKNVVDLARYLLPTPPVPVRFRRRMLALGSGDPTEQLICSSLIARAFQSVRYPIMPTQWWTEGTTHEHRQIVSQVRHYSLFVPRDFDLSPYFDVVKPTVEASFDFRTMRWHVPETEDVDPAADAAASSAS